MKIEASQCPKFQKCTFIRVRELTVLGDQLLELSEVNFLVCARSTHFVYCNSQLLWKPGKKMRLASLVM